MANILNGIKSAQTAVTDFFKKIYAYCEKKQSECRDSKACSLTADILILSAVTAAVTAVNAVLSINSMHITHNDYVHHFMEAAFFTDAMENSSGINEYLFNLFCWNSSYAPGLYASSYFLKPLLGEGIRACLASQLIFFPIIIISLYYAVKPKYGTAAAAAAALFLSSIPNISYAAQKYIVDYPAAAAASFCFCMIANSDYLQKKFYSAALGFGLGLACLCKPTTAAFIIPILILIFLSSLKIFKKHILKLTAVSAVIIISVCLSLSYASKLIGLESSLDFSSLTASVSVPQMKCLLIVFVNYLILFIFNKIVFKKNSSRADKFLSNTLYIFSNFYLVFFPWAMINYKTLFRRTERLNSEFFTHASKLQINYSDFNGIINDHILMLAITAAVIILIRFKHYGTLEKITSFVMMSTLAYSFVLLGPDMRYILPVLPLCGYIIIQIFQKIPFGNAAALFISLTAVSFNVIHPVFFSQYCLKDQESSAVNSRIAIVQLTEHNLFYQGWNIQKYLDSKLPKNSRHFLTAIVNLTDSKAPCENIDYGMKTWMASHQSRTVPMPWDGTNNLINEHERIIKKYASSDSEFAERISEGLFKRPFGIYDCAVMITPKKSNNIKGRDNLIRSILVNGSDHKIYFYKISETNLYEIVLYSADKSLI